MLGYSGGCGTIGKADTPYPYAYRLLSSEAREKMSLKQFNDSFKGIGHITFLQLHQLPAPKGTPENLKYYMVEIEVITGKPVENGDYEYTENISYFAYYYGIVTMKQNADGWNIQDISYFPEEFLCAPFHGWAYDSTSP